MRCVFYVLMITPSAQFGDDVWFWPGPVVLARAGGSDPVLASALAARFRIHFKILLSVERPPEGSGVRDFFKPFSDSSSEVTSSSYEGV